jgi:ABC-type dipeptide/oligopeptide/nickel transport system permease component
MLQYIARRLLYGIPVVFVAVSLVFLAFASIPGDPAQLFIGPEAPQETIEALQRAFGTDQPVHIQYFRYIKNLLHGNLGVSFFSGRPVIQEVSWRFVNTLKLAFAGIVFATVIGVSVGVTAAVKQGTVWDGAVTLGVLFGISMPVFWLGLLMILAFSVKLQWLPSSGIGTWQHIILPAISTSVYSTAFTARMTRSSVLEVIRQDYIRTARAKGLSERIVIFRHALRNALIPVITILGLRLGYLLGGSVVTETIFAWPGLGRLMVAAVGMRDYYVVQGALLIFAVTFVVVNILVDISYAYLDPKVRYR